MNIKDFLIDNYIWIIVILLITIITIIGFLADKNSKNKQKKVQNNTPDGAPLQGTIQNVNNQPMNNMNGMMQYQPPVEPVQTPVNNNMGMVYNNENNQMGPLNQNFNIPDNQVTSDLNNMNIVGENQSMVNNTTIPTNVNLMNNPQPVENVTSNIPEAPMYQPLSEQKPNIPPQPVFNFSNNVNNMPMGEAPLMQPAVSEPIIEPTPSYNQQTTPSMAMDNNNFGVNIAAPMSNYNQNNATIPTPVSPIQTPQPVNPQHIMPNSYNNGQPMVQPMVQPNYSEMMQQPNVEQPMNQQASAQTQTTTPQPLNFVFGPQNNNPNM